VAESLGENAWHVLDHHNSGTHVLRESDHFREEIPLILRTESLPCNRERRTWNPRAQEINTLIRPAGKVTHVTFDDIPFRPVESQRRARVRIVVHETNVVKTSLRDS